MGSGIKVADLYAALGIDDKQFKDGLSKSGTAFGKFGKSIQTASKIAVGAIAGIAVAIGATLVKSLDNAVEQERAWGRVRAVYGDSADAVIEWSEANAFAMGIADDVLEANLANYGNWAKNVGLSTDQAIAQGQELAKRAQEISLATGKSFEEVFAALQKGEQGATRGLKEFGIVADEETLKQQALQMGLWDGVGALDANTKALVTHALIMQDTSTYSEQAANGATKLALAQGQLGVVVDTVMDRIGAAVLEVVVAVLPMLVAGFETVMAWVNENGPMLQSIVETVMAGIGTAISIISDAITFFVDNILPTIVDGFNWITEGGTDLRPVLLAIALAISVVVIPADVSLVTTLGPLILAVGAVMLAVKLLVDAWDSDWGGIRTTLTNIWNKNLKPIFETVAKWLGENLPGILDTLGKVFGTIFGVIGTVVKTQVDIILGVLKVLGDAFGVVMDVLGELGKIADNIWKGITSGIKGAVNGVIGVINMFIRAINDIQIHIPAFETPVGKVGGFDWNGLNLGTIPKLAMGTGFHAGGLAIIGENGPELARLPKGTEVIGHSKAAGMMGASGQPLIGTQVIHGVMPDEVERQTTRAIRRAALGWKLEGA
jgi:hypothetical protein